MQFPLLAGEGQGEGFEQHAANFGKLQIRFARDDVVGELDDGLIFSFITDFRAAEDDYDFRPQPFDGGDDFRGRRDVPDINAEADDFRLVRQNHFRDVERALVDVEFHERCAGSQVAEVGEQIAQAERGMDVFRVERG